ncbi:hypothetical protein [Mesorhizobium escarrei]|nr:hypothetical protein [Mesorhizobium escarrei]
MTVLSTGLNASGQESPSSWDNLPAVKLKGGLKAFWNVRDSSKGANAAIASDHGFASVTLVNTFADYPGGQKENIRNTLSRQPNYNPWERPEFFEKIVRRNVSKPSSSEIWVNDIEFPIERDVGKAWRTAKELRTSQFKSEGEFEKSYVREWSKWFALPMMWTREAHPGLEIGIYGRQVFDRDYWGLYSPDKKRVSDKHNLELSIWRYIDPYVDFYVSGIYLFYQDPGSVYYMAANVEENVRLGRLFGSKPVYAYGWLRFHNSNPLKGNDELDPYLVEALAIVPYFSGAKGVVLWGNEPQIREAGTQPYRTLGLFISQLNRVAEISSIIEGGQFVTQDTAPDLWRAKKPLVRAVFTKSSGCVFMAIDPWQAEDETSSVKADCMNNELEIPLRGRHATILRFDNGKSIEY